MNSILVSHYDENITWFENLNLDVQKFIYSKTNKDYNLVEKNQGQEIPCYLKYIIDNYNKLNDKTLFLHGHKVSPHQDEDSEFICQNVNWNLNNYFSVNRRSWYQEVSKTHQISEGSFDNWLRKNWDIFQGKLEFPEEGLFFYSGAQFVVNKELITQYPITFWQNLFEWVQTTNLSSYITSRIFEYTWHYIFTKNPIEKRYNYIFNEQK